MYICDYMDFPNRSTFFMEVMIENIYIYTNFLVNADSFYNFSIDSHTPLITYYETEISSLMRILVDFVWTDTTWLG